MSGPRTPAREILTVIWEGEQVPGVTFYGLRAPDVAVPAAFPADAWPPGTEVSVSRLHGDAWEVVVWDVAVGQWPPSEDWPGLVRATLQRLIDAGSVVSWLGREGVFCDPPDLLSPDCMGEGVLAALTDDDHFELAVRLDEPLDYLPDSSLLRLRGHAAGLADGS